MNRVPTEIEELVSSLTTKNPDIEEIWLIGSRANGSARPNSDWDILIFGKNLKLNIFSEILEATSSEVDVLIVYDYPYFSNFDSSKTGSLSDWKWSPVGISATYKGTKFVPDTDDDLPASLKSNHFELGYDIVKTQKGELIWSRLPVDC